MRILVFEPLKEPYVKDIEDDIQAMQEVVGGSCQTKKQKCKKIPCP